MTKFKILRADSENNETVDFDERDTIESAREKGLGQINRRTELEQIWKVGEALGKDGKTLNLIFMGRFLTRDEQIQEAVRFTVSRGHDGVLHVSPKAERTTILSDVESAVQERSVVKKKFISKQK